MKNKPTLAEAGYKYVCCLSPKTHLLLNEDGKGEIWVANKGHASSGLRWNKTDLEFVSSYFGAKGVLALAENKN